jgi:hypothetical protein
MDPNEQFQQERAARVESLRIDARLQQVGL